MSKFQILLFAKYKIFKKDLQENFHELTFSFFHTFFVWNFRISKIVSWFQLFSKFTWQMPFFSAEMERCLWRAWRAFLRFQPRQLQGGACCLRPSQTQLLAFSLNLPSPATPLLSIAEFTADLYWICLSIIQIYG